MSKPSRFVKKPFEVEVMRWDGTEKNALEIVSWVRAGGQIATYIPNTDSILSFIRIVTDYDSFRVCKGDYVVFVDSGQIETFSHPTFHQKYQSLRAFKAREKLIDELSKHVCEGTPDD